MLELDALHPRRWRGVHYWMTRRWKVPTLLCRYVSIYLHSDTLVIRSTIAEMFLGKQELSPAWQVKQRHSSYKLVNMWFPR